MTVVSSSPQRTRRTRRTSLGIVLCVLCVVRGGEFARAQEPSAPQALSVAQLQAAIDKLGVLDYDTRTTASRVVRRAAAVQAVPALLQAAAEHADGYVRYRALVILTGFNDPRTTGAMRESLASPNDRLRTVAYSFFEHNPDRAMVPDLLAALDKERAEFVRPALVRALAALGSDPPVQRAPAGRCGADIGKDRRPARAPNARGASTERAAFEAAVDRGGDLPAWRGLRVP